MEPLFTSERFSFPSGAKRLALSRALSALEYDALKTSHENLARSCAAGLALARSIHERLVSLFGLEPEALLSAFGGPEESCALIRRSFHNRAEPRLGPVSLARFLFPDSLIDFSCARILLLRAGAQAARSCLLLALGREGDCSKILELTRKELGYFHDTEPFFFFSDWQACSLIFSELASEALLFSLTETQHAQPSQPSQPSQQHQPRHPVRPVAPSLGKLAELALFSCSGAPFLRQNLMRARSALRGLPWENDPTLAPIEIWSQKQHILRIDFGPVSQWGKPLEPLLHAWRQSREDIDSALREQEESSPSPWSQELSFPAQIQIIQQRANLLAQGLLLESLARFSLFRSRPSHPFALESPSSFLSLEVRKNGLCGQQVEARFAGLIVERAHQCGLDIPEPFLGCADGLSSFLEAHLIRQALGEAPLRSAKRQARLIVSFTRRA